MPAGSIEAKGGGNNVTNLKWDIAAERGTASRTVTSAFEDGNKYEFIELERQFVHQAIIEIVQVIEHLSGNA